MQFMNTKQQVIEFAHSAPSKTMQITSGCELIEKGKSFKGQEITVEGKLKLEDYRKMHDPR